LNRFPAGPSSRARPSNGLNDCTGQASWSWFWTARRAAPRQRP